MNRGDFSTKDIVAAGDLAGDGHGLSVLVVVEDLVSGPVSGLTLSGALRVTTITVVDQCALVDLEELELSLVDLAAVTIARSEIGSSPAVVAAIPAFFATTARTLMVPVESDVGASLYIGGIWRWGGILVRNDV